jgi:hypothetical protein
VDQLAHDQELFVRVLRQFFDPGRVLGFDGEFDHLPLVRLLNRVRA